MYQEIPSPYVSINANNGLFHAYSFQFADLLIIIFQNIEQIK